MNELNPYYTLEAYKYCINEETEPTLNIAF